MLETVAANETSASNVLIPEARLSPPPETTEGLARVPASPPLGASTPESLAGEQQMPAAPG
jgi:hypothetical protein